jgi:hypothetical protein
MSRVSREYLLHPGITPLATRIVKDLLGMGFELSEYLGSVRPTCVVEADFRSTIYTSNGPKTLHWFETDTPNEFIAQIHAYSHGRQLSIMVGYTPSIPNRLELSLSFPDGDRKFVVYTRDHYRIFLVDGLQQRIDLMRREEGAGTNVITG